MARDKFYMLAMKRGRRTVFIGVFPSEYRASTVAVQLGWSGEWAPVIETCSGGACGYTAKARIRSITRWLADLWRDINEPWPPTFTRRTA